jgi:hypothetical protein
MPPAVSSEETPLMRRNNVSLCLHKTTLTDKLDYKEEKDEVFCQM